MFPRTYSLVPSRSLCQSEHASVTGHSLIPGPKRTGNEARWEGMGAVVSSIDATLQMFRNCKKGTFVCLKPPQLIFNDFFYLQLKYGHFMRTQNSIKENITQYESSNKVWEWLQQSGLGWLCLKTYTCGCTVYCFLCTLLLLLLFEDTAAAFRPALY